LPDNKICLTPELLAGEHSHKRSAAGMKRIEDLDFKPQTPGIMTLVRPAPAKVT
jgi:hypothetical protein